MPTQAQRQRDWEFVAELKPEDGRAKTGAPGLEASAADRVFLASLPPSASFGSGDSRQSPAGSAGAEAAFEPLGSGASWGWGGAAGSDTGPSGGGGVQLTAYQAGVGATGQGKAQPVPTAARSNAEGTQPVSRGSGAMPGKTPGGAAGTTNRAASGTQPSGSGSRTPTQSKPTEYFGQSYGSPDPRKQGRQQQIVRTLQGKQAASVNSPYAVAGKVLEAERKLPPEHRRVIEKARNGQPLTLAERRLRDQARERVAHNLGQPFSALEMKYRRLFGPGSINPRSLEVENYLPPLEAIHRFGSPFLTPRAHAARQYSYDLYVRKVLKGEATAPPSFSDNPRYQALQPADLQRIKEWVRANLRIDHRVAMLDLSDPKVKKELAGELALPSRTGVTDFAKQKKLYLDHLRLLSSPQAVTLLGIKTHFGKQLLKAIVDEQLTRLPEARKEWLAHEEDGLQMALLPLAGAAVDANVTQRLAASPNATRVLGPAARGVPGATAGALEGGVQQVQAAYDSGERRPLELAKALGVGTIVGGIGGFFFGSLPAKHLTQVERAQAAALLEQETARLQGVIRSNSGLSRETRHAVQELTQVQSRIAELRDLSQPITRGGVSPQAPRPAPKPPVNVKLPDGTQRGGVNQPLPGAANPA